MQAVRLPAHRKAGADHGADRRRFCRHRQRVLDAGENKFLSKPVQPDDIHALPIARFGTRALGRRVGWADFDDSALAALSPAEPPTSDTPAPSTVNAQTPQLPDSATSATTASAARRRFRASDVAVHLDMAVIGDVCVGVTLAGYQSVLAGFLSDQSGSSAKLLAALDRGDSAALRALAHAVKGTSASLGLRAVNALALQIESAGAGYGPAECSAAAADLRNLLDTGRALLQRMGFARAAP